MNEIIKVRLTDCIEVYTKNNQGSMNKRDFDKEAKNWDDKPDRVKMALDVFNVMNREVGFARNMDILDFGCGTGLLTLAAAPLVAKITGADSSAEMLNVLKAKAVSQNMNNVDTLFWEAAHLNDLPKKYHGIISSMALHHVPSVVGLMKVFYDNVLPAGFIALADLDLDNGEFHRDKAGVFHNGFSREVLSEELVFAGFIQPGVVTAAYVDRPAAEKIRRFSVFLITAKK